MTSVEKTLQNNELYGKLGFLRVTLDVTKADACSAKISPREFQNLSTDTLKATPFKVLPTQP
jgi:hypothetical protein